MKAVVQTEFGATSVLRTSTVPKPAPEAHDILVEVRAVSVNPIDVKKRAHQNLFSFVGVSDVSGPHTILGWDASGVVSAFK
jgi:NADPH:quinone reductase-like Zn-dependent oxidoreductase